MTSHSKSTAQKLLSQILSSGTFGRPTVCVRLGVDEEQLAEYEHPSAHMPLVVQTRLSALAITGFPSASPVGRLGYQLRSQITATVSFLSGETSRSLERPGRGRWP